MFCDQIRSADYTQYFTQSLSLCILDKLVTSSTRANRENRATQAHNCTTPTHSVCPQVGFCAVQSVPSAAVSGAARGLVRRGCCVSAASFRNVRSAARRRVTWRALTRPDPTRPERGAPHPQAAEVASRSADPSQATL